MITRRDFINKSVKTSGMAAIGTVGIHNRSFAESTGADRLPREIWIASISQMGLSADSSSEMVKKILTILDDVMVYKPDIVCLPEVFATSNIGQLEMYEKVKFSSDALETFSDFSRKNRCYTVCSVYTSESGKIFNSAVFFDREGERIGEYRKIYPTGDEKKRGISPGPLPAPVFKTDFGIVGAQICNDIFYDDGWKSLTKQGAELVFWPSAFAGGKMINAMCWLNKYVVVSSTRNNITKICDITGDEISVTGPWNKNWVCAPVNLEKAILRIGSSARYFPEIIKKYGRKVSIQISHQENWVVLESRSPDIFITDILKEFGLKTWAQAKPKS